MNIKRFLLSVLACFIFVFFFEWLFHGMILSGIYESTAQLWRTKEEMAGYMPWAIFSQMAFATIFAWIFTRNYEGKGLGEGVRYGLPMGLFIAVMQFGSYPYMPIPLTLASAWAAGAVVEGTSLGIILSLTYKN